jgi:hypothetical protein
MARAGRRGIRIDIFLTSLPGAELRTRHHIQM